MPDNGSKVPPALATRRAFIGGTIAGLSAAIAATVAPEASAVAPAGQAKEVRESKPRLCIGVFDTAFPDLSTEQLIDEIIFGYVTGH